MAIFHCYVSSPEGKSLKNSWYLDHIGTRKVRWESLDRAKSPSWKKGAIVAGMVTFTTDACEISPKSHSNPNKSPVFHRNPYSYPAWCRISFISMEYTFWFNSLLWKMDKNGPWIDDVRWFTYQKWWCSVAMLTLGYIDMEMSTGMAI